MEVVFIVLGVILFTILLILLLSFIVYKIAFSPLKKEIDDFEIIKNKEYMPYQDKLLFFLYKARTFPYEKVEIKSFDNYKLIGRLYIVDDNAPIYIMVHGYKGSGRRDFAGGLTYFYEKKINVLLIEQRSHFYSEGNAITFGVKERYDIMSWIEYLNQNKRIN